MRVIAGSHGGRRLTAPKGRDTRPTSDRVREALFSSLGATVDGARVLDLYAGSGALGIEALSRGALSAVFVDRAGSAVTVLRDNLKRLGLTGRVLTTDIAPLVQGHDSIRRYGPFDLIFADPPYSDPILGLTSLLAALRNDGALVDGAQVVVERGAHGHDAYPDWLELARRRTYGDTVLLYFRMAPPAAASNGVRDLHP